MKKDLLEALNYKIDEKNLKNDYKSADLVTKNETLNVNSTNVDDLSSLISKLLNNKTLEITIKIKRLNMDLIAIAENTVKNYFDTWFAIFDCEYGYWTCNFYFFKQ